MYWHDIYDVEKSCVLGRGYKKVVGNLKN